MKFEPGDTVGAYRIIGILGRGGMGRVFRVEHTITRRVEAMKVLVDGRSSAQEQAARFQREIQVQASLSHANIAPVHNAFWQDDDLIMIMELVEGRSLQRILEQGRVPLEVAVDYASQMLAALSYAHARGVVHRDVTPGNIMVTTDGIVKLTDFGLAKAPSDIRLTASGDLLGSVYYMSPEQVHGSGTIDEKSDIYSAGAVLYELVSGCKPFPGTTAFTVMQAHVAQAPEPPSKLDARLPRELDHVVLKALAKSPADRHGSAEEFRESLLLVPRTALAAQAGARKSASGPSAASALLAEARRAAERFGARRMIGFGIGFAAVLLAVFIAALLKQRASSAPPPVAGKVAAPAPSTPTAPPRPPAPDPRVTPATVAAPPPQWLDVPAGQRSQTPDPGPRPLKKRASGPAAPPQVIAATPRPVAAPALPAPALPARAATPPPVESAANPDPVSPPPPAPKPAEAKDTRPAAPNAASATPTEPTPTAAPAKRRRNLFIRALGRVVAPLQKKDEPQAQEKEP